MSTRSEFRGINWDVDAVVAADFLLTVPFTQDGLPHPWAGVTVTAAIMSSGESIQVISVSTAVAGQLTFSLTEAQTAAIGKGRYRWAVTFTIGSQTFPVLAGRFELHLSEVSAVTPPPASSIEVSPSGVTGAVPLGLPASIAVGTVTTLAPNAAVTVTITGSGTTRFVNFGIPGSVDWTTPQVVNARVAAYPLVASDVGKLVTVDTAAPVNVTVPAGLGLTAGQRIDLLQLGTGQVTVLASGATVNGTPTLKMRARYSAATLLCVGTNSYVLVGDLAAF